jgi:transposase
MVAIAYKRGVSRTNLPEWYGFSLNTVYTRPQRFEADAVWTAARDKSRLGWPPKLDCEEQAKICQLLQNLPTNAGDDAEKWSIPPVQRLFDEQFDVTYSRTSVFRFLSNTE